ncbi:hypothetical protein BGC_15610 [Burkholderia sp. 3C]
MAAGVDRAPACAARIGRPWLMPAGSVAIGARRVFLSYRRVRKKLEGVGAGAGRAGRARSV